jgi:hypothetical protein
VVFFSFKRQVAFHTSKVVVAGPNIEAANTPPSRRITDLPHFRLDRFLFRDNHSDGKGLVLIKGADTSVSEVD